MSFFVGLWPFVLHFGLGVSAIAACVAIALFVTEIVALPIVGVFLAPFANSIRSTALWVAGCIAIGMFVYAYGAHDEATRCKLQFDAANSAAVKRGTTAHSNAARDAAGGVRDPQDTDK